jgi:hypothetical protein
MKTIDRMTGAVKSSDLYLSIEELKERARTDELRESIERARQTVRGFRFSLSLLKDEKETAGKFRELVIARNFR